MHTCPCGLQEMANCQAVILSVEDDTGHRIIIEDLLEATRSPEVGMRQAAAIILNMYCSRSKADYSSHLRSLVSGLIRLFNDSSPVVLEESWDALNAITKVRAADCPTVACSALLGPGIWWWDGRFGPPWGPKIAGICKRGSEGSYYCRYSALVLVTCGQPFLPFLPHVREEGLGLTGAFPTLTEAGRW